MSSSRRHRGSPRAGSGGPAGSEDPREGIESTWCFVIIAEIANFTALRRHLGAPRANLLSGDLAEAIGEFLPEARVSTAARDAIEIGFTGGHRSDLDAILTRIHDSVLQPLDIDGEFHAVDLTLGASAAIAHECDDVRLIEEAETALREARSERTTVARDIAEVSAAIDRITLARDLPAAIETGHLFLQYQPKVHVRRQEVASLEALIRWNHPERGLILPGDFIPMAEETPNILPLTLWTIRQAIADQCVLAQHGHQQTIFINIAGKLLADRAFVREACALVKMSGAKLGFEITETSVIRDPESAIRHLKIFAEIGVIIAIDDYGAGLSSLAYLKQLPARELKIDKLFVTQLTSSNRDPLIVRSTIDLAHAMEMEVVAEGVETPAAMALLSVMGCDMIQGFLISRPLGLDAIIQFLDTERHLDSHTHGFSPLARSTRGASSN